MSEGSQEVATQRLLDRAKEPSQANVGSEPKSAGWSTPKVFLISRESLSTCSSPRVFVGFFTHLLLIHKSSVWLLPVCISPLVLLSVPSWSSGCCAFLHTRSWLRISTRRARTHVVRLASAACTALRIINLCDFLGYRVSKNLLAARKETSQVGHHPTISATLCVASRG